MKKIITLVVCAGAFLSAFAQTPAEESRRIILGRRTNTGSGSENTSNDPRDILGRRTGNTSDYPNGTRDQQIEQVNREYDAKIYSVRNNPNLSQAEKERIIRQLNADRARRIREINNRSNDRRDRDGRYEDRRDRRHDDRRDHDHGRDRDHDDDDDYRKDKKYKTNNGNHYGWEKGKGNPHKNGGHPGKGKKGKKH